MKSFLIVYNYLPVICFLAVLSIFAPSLKADVITPNSITLSGATEFLSPANLINGSGLSSTSLSNANISSITHEFATEDNAWATEESSEDDYYQSFPFPITLDLTFDSPQTIDGFAYWGYSFDSSGFGSDGEVRSFEFRFFAADGSLLGSTVSKVTNSPTNQNVRFLSLPVTVGVSRVEVLLTDNHFKRPFGNGHPGGNSVGFTELRFLSDSEDLTGGVDSDYDSDGSLGVGDLAAYRTLEFSEPTSSSLDFNRDGLIDNNDWTALLEAFEDFGGSVITVNAVDDPVLREAIEVEGSSIGDYIDFDEALSGDTITLTIGELVIDKSLFIDASNLGEGITIDAGGNRGVRERVMRVEQGHTVALKGLTLTGGRGQSFRNIVTSGRGGAIFVDGGNSGLITRLTLTACTLTGNSAALGGGIFSGGQWGSTDLKLHSCTLAGNSAFQGGAIHSSGAGGMASLTLNNCTLSGNSTSTEGITGEASAEGGGIYITGSNGAAELRLENTIIADNTASIGPDLRDIETDFTFLGGNSFETNLIGNNSGSSVSDFPNLIGTSANPVDPKLAPLGYYGGPAMTMHPLVDSPAILTGSEDNTRTDQRGFILTGTPTIGAVKLGPVITVDTAEDENDDEPTGDLSLREAIVSATDPATVIRFDLNVFDGDSEDKITLTEGELVIAKSLFIDAGDIADSITIDADGGNTEHGVIRIEKGHTVALHRLTLTGGQSSFGGGIRINGGETGLSTQLILSTCNIWGNSASVAGGGVYSEGSDEGNVGLRAYACNITGNSAFRGGGIFNSGFVGRAELMLNSCNVSENSSRDSGGGVFNEGGIDRYELCTLSGNLAENVGGGIFTERAEDNSEVVLDSCTISGNFAFGGAGVFSTGVGLILNNTILSNNIGNSGVSDLVDTERFTELRGMNLISDLSDSNLLEGPNLIVNPNPKLAPLSYYGGPTMTMHPLAGSPAILSGADTTRTDQRGFTLTGPPTIGAVKLGPVTTVDTAVDEDDGILTSGDLSLREAISSVEADPAAVIRFDPNVFDGGVEDAIILGDQELGVFTSLIIDASNITGGVTIDADGENTEHRVMRIGNNSIDSPNGSAVSLHGLNLTGGKALGGSPPSGGRGGGILIESFQIGASMRVILNSCNISENSAPSGRGGGIYNRGFAGSAMLVLHSCTLSGNTAFNGGGIYNDGFGGEAKLTLNACTLSENSAEESGGGISNNSFGDTTEQTLRSCTLSRNSASCGAGIWNDSTGGSSKLTLENTIIAGNIMVGSFDNGFCFSADIQFGNASDIFLGENLLFDPNPQLAPLGYYGGPTMTMPPLPGSPAIDAVFDSLNSGSVDQRGLGRFVGSGQDIGAVEIQGVSDTQSILTPLWLTDFDDDGIPFGVEFAVGTNPLAFDLPSAVTPGLSFNGDGDPVLSVDVNPDAQGFATWIIESSTDLQTWPDELFRSSSPDPAGVMETQTNNMEPRRFYRFRAEQVQP